MSDCCGGSPIYTLAQIDAGDKAIGTAAPIPGVTLNPILMSGENDASTVITMERPWFSPSEEPASAMVTRISVQKDYDVLGFANGCFSESRKTFNAQEVMHPENWWRFAEINYYGYISMRNAAHRAQYHWPSLRIGKIAENDAGPIVGTFFAYSEDTLFLFCSGSSNNQQLALQAASSFLGVVACGDVRTSAFWCNAWTQLDRRLMGYGFPDRPKVVIMGHSYGGVMASLFAARIKAYRPEKDVSLITLGMPCPGDLSFADALRAVRAVHIVNEGDGVAAVPPAGLQFASINWILTLGQIGAWQTFSPVSNRYLVTDTGAYRYTNDCPVSFGILTETVQTLAAGGTPDPFDAHRQGVYLERLRLVAGLPV